MSADLETRIRATLRDVPEPEGLGARLRAGTLAALGEAPATRRRWRPRLGRGVRWAAGAVAVCGVAALLGLLLVATPSDSPTGDGRETAVEYVLRALPNREGVTPEAAGARLAEIVRTRSDEIGARGVTVQADGDRVTVVAPGTHDVGWITVVIGELNLSVFDRDAVFASGPLDEVVAAAQVAPGGIGPRAWYVVVPARPSPDQMPDYLEGPFGTEGEAVQKASAHASRGWTGARAESVPAGLTLAQGDGDTFLALREPIVRPGDIARIDADGTTVSITVDESARPAVAAALARGARPVVVRGAATWSGMRFLGFDEAAGELSWQFPSTPGTSPAAVVQFADSWSKGLDALVAVEQARPVGPAPPRRGQPVDDALPEALVDSAASEMGLFPPRDGSALLALTTRHAGRRYDVYTWITPVGEEAMGVNDPRGGMATSCGIRPESPEIQPCVGGSPDGGSTYQMLGRVRDGVDSVRIVYPDGSTAAPAVANGVILAFLPRDRPMPVRVEALDASGTVVGTVDPRTPDNRLIYGG